MDARRIKKFDHILAFGETVFLGWGVMPRVRQTSKSNPAGAAGHLARYVALLRAVNVGGRKLSMSDLRGLVADLGGTDVETYLQSGNVVFTAPKSVATTLADAVSAHCGFASPTASPSSRTRRASSRRWPISSRMWSGISNGA